MCVIKPQSSEKITDRGLLLVSQSERQTCLGLGHAAISEWNALQWKHTSAGWYSSQVALELQTCLILQTQLVFSYSLFSILPLCLFQSMSLFHCFSLLPFSAILYVNIYFTLHLPLFTVTLIFLSSLHACWNSPECQSSVTGERFPKVGMEYYSVFLASLKLYRIFDLKKKSIVLLCALFLYLFRVLHPAGGGNANSVRVLKGKRRVHLHIFASY